MSSPRGRGAKEATSVMLLPSAGSETGAHPSTTQEKLLVLFCLVPERKEKKDRVQIIQCYPLTVRHLKPRSNHYDNLVRPIAQYKPDNLTEKFLP